MKFTVKNPEKFSMIQTYLNIRTTYANIEVILQ